MIEEKSEHLRDGARQFDQGANTLRKQMLKRKIMVYLCIGLLVIFLGFLIYYFFIK